MVKAMALAIKISKKGVVRYHSFFVFIPNQSIVHTINQATKPPRCCGRIRAVGAGFRFFFDPAFLIASFQERQQLQHAVARD